jgi:hypothetical protein
MTGVHPILGVRDRPRGRKFIPELGRRRSRCVGQAPPDPRRAWACTLLEAALVRDLSWAALGRHYRCDPKTACAWVIAVIKALRTI